MRLTFRRLSAGRLIIASLFVLAGCRVNTDRIGPVDEVLVEMTGANHNWVIRYAGPDGELNTNDDHVAGGDLLVPADRPIHVLLQSEDYVYGFLSPELAVNQIAVPDLTFDFRFEATGFERTPFSGDQLCGQSYETLNGNIVILSAAEYAEWLDGGQQPRLATAQVSD